jgi:cyclic pyranopterin monophosphate synthase
MNDISQKTNTLRTARAVAQVHCSAKTVELILNNRLPKGNLFDVARAAGLLGAKATPTLIPHCHPIPIEHLDISFDTNIEGDKGSVLVTVVAKTIYKTGIEIEAVTAATIAALTIFDLLKPVDKNLQISGIRLVEKFGGKTDRQRNFGSGKSAAILVCSDSVAAEKREDVSGALIKSTLESHGITINGYAAVPDESDAIRKQAQRWIEDGIDFIFTTGGTGIGPRDIVAETLAPLIEKQIPGIAEAMRAYGQDRTPLAMFSRSFAGTIGNTVLVCLPGSSAGVRESLAAILPALFHAKEILHGGGH